MKNKSIHLKQEDDESKNDYFVGWNPFTINQPPLQLGFPGISFGHKNPPPSHNPQPQAQPWPGIFEQYIGGCRTIAAFDGKHSKQINVKGCDGSGKCLL